MLQPASMPPLDLAKPIQDIKRDTPAEHDKRMAWWREARFGMFIHWGLYAVPAGYWNGKEIEGAGEWMLNNAQIKVADYEPLIHKFNPVKFDADKWVSIAKGAGMKYIVITSKHHEGFGLWPSKQGDWNIASTPYKKDILKQLAAACKKQGIKLCFYHSIMDWHETDYLPRRSWDPRPNEHADFERYVKYLKGQLKELLTNYGDIGLVWFDGQWESTWTHERGKDLYQYVRSLQPNIIINNRVDGHGSTKGDEVGDYGTPEQTIPANGMPGQDWESCMTMNDTWGFSAHDHNWKSSVTLVHNVIDCASKGGNYLLNVGPTPEGEIPAPSVERLAEVGKWMKANGEAIYGSQAGPFPKQLPWGRVTRKGRTLYLHVFDPHPGDEIELTGLQTPITAKGTQVHEGTNGPKVVVPNTQPTTPGMPVVIKVQLTAEPVVSTPVLSQNADGSLDLKAIDANTSGGNTYEQGKDCIGFWTNEGDTVDWTFEVKKTGDFQVQLEFACPPDSAGANYAVQVAGQSLKGTVTSTGSWEQFTKVDLGKLTLSNTGKTKLVVKPLSKPGYGVMNLRAIHIKPL